VPFANSIGGRGVWVRTNTGTSNGGSSPHQPRHSGSSGFAWSPNIPAPMISAPMPWKYCAAYFSSTPVVPAPLVSRKTRSWKVRVAV